MTEAFTAGRRESPLTSDFEAATKASEAVEARRQYHDFHGQLSGAVEGKILHSAAAAVEAGQTAKAAEKRRAKRQKYQDLLFELLRLGELDTYVAETVFAGMSADDIIATVSAIETETGQSFEDYAANILGTDMPERGLNEDLTEYHQRVLTAVADAALNDDLTIKPGFEDDPLVQIIVADQIYQDALSEVTDSKAEMKELDQAIDTSPAAQADNSDAFIAFKM